MINLVVEVRGGVIQQVYADTAVKVVIVDWDEVEESSHGSYIAAFLPLEKMPAETSEQVLQAKE